MKSLSNPIHYGWPRPNAPDVGGPGGAVSPDALCAVREADATISNEEWEYAPTAGLPGAPPTSGERH